MHLDQRCAADRQSGAAPVKLRVLILVEIDADAEKCSWRALRANA